MTTINIGIVAHVDAGKTSLTERILYDTHVTGAIGRVDKGTTQTDSLDLEKRRGITIKASVVSFFIDALKVNLIDTPGHADFLAEVERALSVLDGAILVISAVEGIQAQTTILFLALRKLRIPTILFINKIDRRGAQDEELLSCVREKLSEHILSLYHTAGIGTKQVSVVRNSLHNPAFLQVCLEQLTLFDEELLAAYVEGEPITEARVRTAITRSVGESQLFPVFFGSAITGVGVQELLADLGSYVPSTTSHGDDPLSGIVFKLEKDGTGERVAYVRLFTGNVRVRSFVNRHRRMRDGTVETYAEKIQKLHLFYEGKTVQVQQVDAGEFCKVWGWKDVKIGDIVGEASDHIKTLHFATPRYETQIEVTNREDDHDLYLALQEMAEEDPLIYVLKDEVHQSIYLRIFGQVQKEVIEAMLLEQYGLKVAFSRTTIVCIEKPSGTGEAIDHMGAADNPFKASVGLSVEPGPEGSGITYRSTPGALPLHFHRAIEEAVRATLAQGLYGWEVTDIVVTLTHTGYDSHRADGTKGGDFRNLVPLVLMEALAAAGTDVYEPINSFELSVPMQSISTAMFKLSVLRAVYGQPVLRNNTFHLTGTLPVATTEEFRRELPSFTEGEGVLLVQEGSFLKMEGEFPVRKRMDHNPLNRKEYLLSIQGVW